MNARLPARSLLKLAALAAILLLAAPSCQKEEPESQLPDYSNDITNTANALSASWLKDQLDTYPEENICLSSFPLVMLGSALAAGADGDTARQLWQFTAQSLTENGSPPADFNPSSYLHHIRQLNGLFAKNIPGYYLYNGLYANKKVELFSRYKKRISKNLDMDIVSTDFSRNPTKIEVGINRKVSERTHGLVQNTLSPGTIDPRIPYLMFNVLAFEGKWKVPFDTESTTEDTFYTNGNEGKVTTPFMFSVTYNFREADKYTLLWLDYAQSTARFIVVLPKQKTGLSHLVHEMNKDSFPEYIALINSPQKKFEKEIDRSRDLYLPKFELFAKTRDCISFMEKQGVKDCFLSKKADFSQMMEQSYKIEKILQKCFLQVDEQGAKAYAVTTVIPEHRMIPPERKKLNIDHPFLCFIMDTKTNMIFFTAVIKDPTKTEHPSTLMRSGGKPALKDMPIPTLPQRVRTTSK